MVATHSISLQQGTAVAVVEVRIPGSFPDVFPRVMMKSVDGMGLGSKAVILADLEA